MQNIPKFICVISVINLFLASIPARRFPDQDSIQLEDYEHFSELSINGIITESIVIGAK